MADTKVFKLVEGVTLAGIAGVVENLLRENKKLYVETIEAGDGFLIQAREEGKLKTFTGMGVSTQVQVIPMGGDNVTVNVGSGKWVDKAGAAAVGAVLFFPLAITAGIGICNQQKLPELIFKSIDNYIVSGGRDVKESLGSVRSSGGAREKISCPHCGSSNDKDSAFCSTCGKALKAVCPKCGKEVHEGSRFCSSCGFDLTSE